MKDAGMDGRRASFRTIFRRCAGCGVLLVSLAYSAHGARAQQEQNPPATQTTPADQSAQPANTQSPTQHEPAVWSGQPATVVQPRPGTQPNNDAVHATGGIINSHPEDILNRPGDYTAPLPAPASPEPAPPVIPASNLSQLNQTPDSVQFTDRVRGPYRLTVEESGVWSSNVFNANTGQIASEYVDIAVPLGIQKTSERTSYSLYYRPDYTIFPQYTQLNHLSQYFTQQLDHKATDLTDISWNFAGGRVVSTGQYIPSQITVGSTTVIQPVSASALNYTYNLATDLGVTHRIDERDSISTAITGAWMEQPTGVADKASYTPVTRSEVAGLDVHLTRLLSPRTILGVELNDIFVRGLWPVGHSNFVSAKGTYTAMLSQHVSLVLGAGPLYGDTVIRPTQGVTAPQGSTVSYAADAGIIYQTSYARISAGYDRALQIGYLGGPLPTHQVYGAFDRPLTSSMDLVVNANYGHTAGDSGSTAGLGYGYSMTGVSARLSDNLTSNLSVFVGAARFQQNAPGTTSDTFGRTDISGGLTFSFGVPLTRRGDHQ